MLKKLRVKNFKCFREAKEFDFGRITLLLGANSSGKSSVMYAVLGAIQSDEFPFQFSPNGRFVNMGDYRDMVWGHEVEREIEIGLEMDVPGYNCNTIWKADERNLPALNAMRWQDQILDLEVTQTNGFEFDWQFELEALVLKGGNSIDNLTKAYLAMMSQVGNKKSKKQHLKVDEIHEFLLPREGQFSKDEESRRKLLSGFIREMETQVSSHLNFISSFRLHPERTYYESTKSELKVEKFGEGYLDQIMLWDAKFPKISHELLSWMQEMELITDLKANRLGGGRYDVQVKTKESGVFAALSDVGFGLSQFLPILVADIQLPDDSTLFIQQPESQLHPSVQANFGDYLTKRVNETQKNYVVETHSEYLLNRIRLNIVKGLLKPEDLQVYFLEAEENDTAVYKIEFTTDGKIEGAPENFFKTYFGDVMDIAIHAIPE